MDAGKKKFRAMIRSWIKEAVERRIWWQSRIAIYTDLNEEESVIRAKDGVRRAEEHLADLVSGLHGKGPFKNAC